MKTKNRRCIQSYSLITEIERQSNGPTDFKSNSKILESFQSIQIEESLIDFLKLFYYSKHLLNVKNKVCLVEISFNCLCHLLLELPFEHRDQADSTFMD